MTAEAHCGRMAGGEAAESFVLAVDVEGEPHWASGPGLSATTASPATGAVHPAVQSPQSALSRPSLLPITRPGETQHFALYLKHTLVGFAR